MDNLEHIIDIYQLINSENVGPVTFYKLIKEFGSANDAISNIQKFKRINLLDRTVAINACKEAYSQGIKLITYDSEYYPLCLKNIKDMPPLLYALGNIECLKAKVCVSIVGARNASINGRKIASRIAYDLTQQGIMVVSGMARGIDAAAHKGALYANNQQGATIAVLGTGVDVAYPEENTDLHQSIGEQGCIISAFAPHTLPQATNFPQRNQIVAAISKATLVIEAGIKSGSLITAKLADDYGRILFAVPGSPTETKNSGSNRLIKAGAHLTESAEDILQILSTSPDERWYNTTNTKQTMFDFNKITQNMPQHSNEKTQEIASKTKIIDYLSYEGVYVDEIIRALGKDASQVAMELLELEIAGKIERQSGNKVALIKGKNKE